MLDAVQLEKPPIVDLVLSNSGRFAPVRHAWGELIDELRALRSLEDDWDGQGAKAPDRDLVESAIKLAVLLRDHQIIPAHYATAGVNGTIHFEWIEADRSLDVEVMAPGLAEISSVDLLGSPAALNVCRW